MRKSFKSTGPKLLKTGLQILLILIFFLQLVILNFLLTYGYIPLPSQWINKQLHQKSFNEFHIQAESFRLKLTGEIELTGIHIYGNEIPKPILEAACTTINFSFYQKGRFEFNVNELVVTNGTLQMPAIYAPNGRRTPILERVTFHLKPTKQQIQIDSFAGKHEDIYLRGSIQWPIVPQKTSKKTSINQLYKIIASALKEKTRFSPLNQPTLEFALSTRLDNSIDVSLLLSCEQLKHPKITGKYFSFGTNFVLNQGQLDAQAPLLLRAQEITFGDLDIFAEGIVAHITRESWPDFFNGTLPEFEVSAYRLTTGKVEVDAPRIRIDPSTFPVLQFSGTTCGFQGSASFSGAFNSTDKSGKINANGAIDIFDLLPDPLVAKLPTLEFGSTPFYNLSVDFNEGFEVSNVRFHVNIKDLTANKLNFDNITADGCYRRGILNFENIQIDREHQWVDGFYYHNIQTKDFQIGLLGSALPKQYNSLMPKWWDNIFKDLHFDKEAPIHGDFVIQGNMQKAAGKIALFGHVQGKKMAYKDAFFDTFDSIVRNRRNYFEIHNIKAKVGEGRGTGNLGFTSARKPRKGLVSVRYDFDASLPLETASNALGGTIADVLSNAELTGLPDVQVDGVFFNKDFKEYANKDKIDLQAKIDTPLKLKEIQLDHLKLKLIGLGSDIHLRDIQFGYADGIANAMIDILPTESNTPEMCFKMELKDANQAKAIQNLSSSNEEGNNDPARVSGLVDLNLHAKGPLTDLYGFEGYGNLEVRNKALGSIQLLGPLSQLLQNTRFGFTSFNLDRLSTLFVIDQKQLVIDKFEINGPRTRISATGTLQLPDQALDMGVSVNLFGNVGNPDSAINALGRAITSPLPNLLSFKLSGTIDNQRIRSQLDPRNFIPGL